jgi:hypothetical protein
MTGHRRLSILVRDSAVEHEDAKSAVQKFNEVLDWERKMTSFSTSQKKQGQAKEPNPPESQAPRAELEPATSWLTATRQRGWQGL